MAEMFGGVWDRTTEYEFLPSPSALMLKCEVRHFLLLVVNQIFHTKRSDGFEEWIKIDVNGCKKWKKDSDGVFVAYNAAGNVVYEKRKMSQSSVENEMWSEIWREYDARGNLVREKSKAMQNGKCVYFRECRNDFDGCGNCVSSKEDFECNGTSGSNWMRSEFDEAENCVRVECCENGELFSVMRREYDDEGRPFHEKTIFGPVFWRRKLTPEIFDKIGREKVMDCVLKMKCKQFWNYIGEIASEQFWKYDESGNLMHKKTLDICGNVIDEEWREYDECGNCVHEKHGDGYEEWREYDECGFCVHEKHSDGYEKILEYDGIHDYAVVYEKF